MTPPNPHRFTSGDLVFHHRFGQGVSITCGALDGCVTSVVEDVACLRCREVLAALSVGFSEAATKETAA